MRQATSAALPLQERVSRNYPMSEEQVTIDRRLLATHGKGTGIENRTTLELGNAASCLLADADQPIDGAADRD